MKENTLYIKDIKEKVGDNTLHIEKISQKIEEFIQNIDAAQISNQSKNTLVAVENLSNQMISILREANIGKLSQQSNHLIQSIDSSIAELKQNITYFMKIVPISIVVAPTAYYYSFTVGLFIGIALLSYLLKDNICLNARKLITQYIKDNYDTMPYELKFILCWINDKPKSYFLNTSEESTFIQYITRSDALQQLNLHELATFLKTAHLNSSQKLESSKAFDIAFKEIDQLIT
jgi:hypothetical protein